MTSESGAKNSDAPKKKKTKRDAEATKANIIEVATAEFAAYGLSGARIDEIAAKTNTSKRMIYYYFEDKEGLYRRVLEDCYARVRTGESALDLENLPPVEALRALVEFTFDHHSSNPDFVRLVMIENIHNAEHLVVSDLIQSGNVGVINRIRDIYNAGVASGDFRKNLEPVEIHWMISALAFFNVSNSATFSRVFNWSTQEPQNQKALKKDTVEAVLKFVMAKDL